MKQNAPYIFLVCLLSAIFLAACGQSEEEVNATATKFAADVFSTQTADAPIPTETPIPTPTPTLTPIPTPTPTLPPPDYLLETAFTGLKERSYHFVYEDHFGAFIYSMEGDFQAPDRLQSTSNMSSEDQSTGEAVMGADSGESKSILLGDTLFSTNPEIGTWEKDVLDDPDSYLSEFYTNLFGARPEDINDLIFIGEETLNGEPVYLLEGTVPLQKIAAFEFYVNYVPGLDVPENNPQVSYWIGVKDGYLRQVVIEGEVPMLDIMLTLSQKTTLSEFGKEVVIEEPDVNPLEVYKPGLKDIQSEFSQEENIFRIAPDGTGEFPDLITAVDSVEAGATLMLEPGVYQLRQPLEIDKSLRMIGAGKQETEIVSTAPGYVVRFSGDGSFAVEGILFRHQGETASDIVVVENGRIALTNCAFTGAANEVDGKLAAGLRLQGSTVGVVQGCDATANPVGMSIEAQAQPLIEGNLCSNNDVGIQVSRAAKPILVKNSCNENEETGIEYYDSAGGVARGNDCSGNTWGIAVIDQGQPSLEENTCNDNENYGIYYGNTAGGIAWGNDISGNTWGIGVHDQAQPILENNACRDNENHGIVYSNNAGGIARGNDCSGNAWGIGVHEQAQPILERNICNDNENYGIVYVDDSGGKAQNNQCSGNWTGISVFDQAMPTLEENTCSDNDEDGIYFGDTSGGFALKNSCSSNGNHGISVDNQANPTLEKNVCSGNQVAGIAFLISTSASASQNECSENLVGIAVYDRAQPTLEGNNCQNNKNAGIAFYDNSSGLAQKNECTANLIGILVKDTTNPDLVENDCHDNTETDVKDERP